MNDWVLNWFKKRNPGVVVHPEGDFHKQRWIDSLGFIELIEDIEKQFNVVLSFEELSLPTVKTIKGLTALVEKKVKGAA